MFFLTSNKKVNNPETEVASQSVSSQPWVKIGFSTLPLKCNFMVAENNNAHRQKVTTFLTLGHCKTVFHKIQKDERKGHFLLPFFFLFFFLFISSPEIHLQNKRVSQKKKRSHTRSRKRKTSFFYMLLQLFSLH